ncbi:MAG: LAO/AO transport system kinase [Planctomycetota bacterium]
MSSVTPEAQDLAQLVKGVLQRDPASLGRAITLIESEAPKKRAQAEALLRELLQHPGKSDRIGITGVPGVGKSTFIDALGTHLTAQGHRVAVLAVDPTSPVTGGSILGDKTRMGRLAQDPNAFIRPSPSSGTLGGVAARTRESMQICEAAGFDVLLIETVGVGQSEVVAREMVDFFLVLMLAGAGDELQGIKRGILELADMIAINKADGDNKSNAERARNEYASALHYMQRSESGWTPDAVCVSALEGTGLAELWESISEHQDKLRASGSLETKRSKQRASWMWQEVQERLRRSFDQDEGVRGIADKLEGEVRSGSKLPSQAAQELLAAFLGRQ